MPTTNVDTAPDTTEHDDPFSSVEQFAATAAPVSASLKPPPTSADSGSDPFADVEKFSADSSGKSQLDTIKSYIAKYADKYGIDPEIADAMAKQESGYKPGAVSKKGATGVFQLMGDTAKQLGVDPNDPEQNVEGGLRYMSQLLKKYDGNYPLALAAFNSGGGNVDKYHGIPPFPETRDYVKTILAGKTAQPAVATDDPFANITKFAATGAQPTVAADPFSEIDKYSAANQQFIPPAASETERNRNALLEQLNAAKTPEEHAAIMSQIQTANKKVEDEYNAKYDPDGTEKGTLTGTYEQALMGAGSVLDLLHSPVKKGEELLEAISPAKVDWNDYPDWVKDSPWLLGALEFTRGAGHDTAKEAIDFFGDPVNWPFFFVGGPLGKAVRPALRAGVDGFFSLMMAHNGYQGFREAADGLHNGDDDQFWNGVKQMGMGAWMGMESAMGAKHQYEMIKPLVKLDDLSRSTYDRPWFDLNQQQKARVLYDMAGKEGTSQEEAASLTRHAMELGLDPADPKQTRKTYEAAVMAGASPDSPFSYFSNVTPEQVNEQITASRAERIRKQQLTDQQEKAALSWGEDQRKADETLVNAPEKRESWETPVMEAGGWDNLTPQQIADSRRRMVEHDALNTLAEEKRQSDIQDAQDKAKEQLDQIAYSKGYDNHESLVREAQRSVGRTGEADPFERQILDLARAAGVEAPPYVGPTRRDNMFETPIIGQPREAGRGGVILTDQNAGEGSGVREAAAPVEPPASQGMPPVPADHIRLYRGEPGPNANKTAVPAWVEEAVERTGVKQARGRWFTDDLNVAKWYQHESGAGGRIVYLDVPKDIAGQYNVGLHPEAKSFSADPEREFFLPKDYVGKGKPIADVEPEKQTPEQDAAGLARREANLRDASETIATAGTHATDPQTADDMAVKAAEAAAHAAELRRQREEVERKINAAKHEKDQPLGETIHAVKGHETKIEIPGLSDYPAHYAVVSAKALRPSHDPFTWTKQDNAFQPRNNYDKPETQLEVTDRGQKVIPTRLITDNPTAEQGPPIIRKDGLVAGGNSRSMVMKLAYRNGEPGEQIYKRLLEKATSFGINPSDIPPMSEQPVLVRILDKDHIDRAEMYRIGDELNISAGAAYSNAETAVKSAKFLSDSQFETIAGLLSDNNWSMRDLMRNKGDWVRDLMLETGIIHPGKRDAYTDNGELNDEGKALFEYAVMGRIIPDADILRRAQRDIPGIVGKLDRTLGVLARIKARNDIWSVPVDRIPDALRLHLKINSIRGSLREATPGWKESDSLVDLYLHPDRFKGKTALMDFGGGETVREQVDPITESLAKLLEDNTNEVKKSLESYIKAAEQGDTKDQGGFSFFEPPTPWGAFNDSVAKPEGLEVKPDDWAGVRPQAKLDEEMRPTAPVEEAQEPTSAFKPLKTSQEMGLDKTIDDLGDAGMDPTGIANRLRQQNGPELSQYPLKDVLKVVQDRQAERPPQIAVDPVANIIKDAGYQTVGKSYGGLAYEVNDPAHDGVTATIPTEKITDAAAVKAIMEKKISEHLAKGGATDINALIAQHPSLGLNPPPSIEEEVAKGPRYDERIANPSSEEAAKLISKDIRRVMSENGIDYAEAQRIVREKDDAASDKLLDSLKDGDVIEDAHGDQWVKHGKWLEDAKDDTNSVFVPLKEGSTYSREARNIAVESKKAETAPPPPAHRESRKEELKAKVGADFVKDARGLAKTKFLSGLSEAEQKEIKEKTGLTPEEFWLDVNGKKAAVAKSEEQRLAPPPGSKSEIEQHWPERYGKVPDVDTPEGQERIQKAINGLKGMLKKNEERGESAKWADGEARAKEQIAGMEKFLKPEKSSALPPMNGAVGDIEDGIENDHADAALIDWAGPVHDSKAAIAKFRAQMEDRGWKWNADEKQLEKDGWYVFTRSQGELSPPIAQWDKLKTEAKDEAALKPPPKEEKTGKEPWEMSLEDFMLQEKESRGFYNLTGQRQRTSAMPREIEADWDKSVEEAIRAGKKLKQENIPHWALTAEESAKRSDDTYDEDDAKQHAIHVLDAVKEGKPVPEKVRKEAEAISAEKEGALKPPPDKNDIADRSTADVMDEIESSKGSVKKRKLLEELAKRGDADINEVGMFKVEWTGKDGKDYVWGFSPVGTPFGEKRTVEEVEDDRKDLEARGAVERKKHSEYKEALKKAYAEIEEAMDRVDELPAGKDKTDILDGLVKRQFATQSKDGVYTVRWKGKDKRTHTRSFTKDGEPGQEFVNGTGHREPDDIPDSEIEQPKIGPSGLPEITDRLGRRVVQVPDDTLQEMEHAAETSLGDRYDKKGKPQETNIYLPTGERIDRTFKIGDGLYIPDGHGSGGWMTKDGELIPNWVHLTRIYTPEEMAAHPLKDVSGQFSKDWKELKVDGKQYFTGPASDDIVAGNESALKSSARERLENGDEADTYTDGAIYRLGGLGDVQYLTPEQIAGHADAMKKFGLTLDAPMEERLDVAKKIKEDFDQHEKDFRAQMSKSSAAADKTLKPPPSESVDEALAAKQQELKAANKAYKELRDKSLAASTQGELKKYFEPGKIVPGYAGARDKVISFNPSKMDPFGWTVTVRGVDKDGNFLPGADGRERTHATMPSLEEQYPGLKKEMKAAQNKAEDLKQEVAAMRKDLKVPAEEEETKALKPPPAEEQKLAPPPDDTARSSYARQTQKMIYDTFPDASDDAHRLLERAIQHQATTREQLPWLKKVSDAAAAIDGTEPDTKHIVEALQYENQKELEKLADQSYKDKPVQERAARVLSQLEGETAPTDEEGAKELAAVREQLAKIKNTTPEQRMAVEAIWQGLAKYKGLSLGQFIKKYVADVTIDGKPGEKALYQDAPPKFNKMLKAAGAEPLGVMDGTDLVFFNDPETHGTLAMRQGEMTPESVKAHMEEHRAEYNSDANQESRAKAAGGRLFQADNVQNKIWVSKAETLVNEKMKGPMSGNELAAMLKNGGVKADEMKWTGLDDFLKENKKVSPEEVKQFLKENAVELKEFHKGDNSEAKAPLITWPAEQAEGAEKASFKPHADSWDEAKYNDNAQEVQDRLVANNGKLPAVIHRGNMTDEDGQHFGYAIRHFPDLGSYEAYGGAEGRFLGAASNYHDAQLLAQEDVDRDHGDPGRQRNATKYQSWMLPGGTRYREVGLMLPSHADAEAEARRIVGEAAWEKMGLAERIALTNSKTNPARRGTFVDGHWSEPNVLVHALMDDRIDADGKKTLMVHEVQSDWAREAAKKGVIRKPLTRADIEIRRIPLEEFAKESAFGLPPELKEFREKNGLPLDAPVVQHKLKDDPRDVWSTQFDPTLTDEDIFKNSSSDDDMYTVYGAENRRRAQGVPDLPFRDTWHELMIRRLLRMAAEEGYERLAFSTGDIVKDRYDLSKHVDHLDWNPRTEELTAWKSGEEADYPAIAKKVPANELEKVLGKETAKKLLDAAAEIGDTSGEIVPGSKVRWFADGKVQEGEYIPNRPLKSVGEWPPKTFVPVKLEDGKIKWIDGQEIHRISLRNVDLQVGGEWANNLYDKAIPNYLRQYGKKWDAKVGDTLVERGIDAGKTYANIKRFYEFPEERRADIKDYVDDVGADWDPRRADFAHEAIAIEDLLRAERRPLPKLSDVDLSMAGKSQTEGPLILDDDFSVIDGMHRVAAAIKNGDTQMEAYIRRSGDADTVKVHAIDVTDSMKKSVMDGQFLFQDKAGKKGAVEFLSDGRAVIHAFESADVSTLVHETAHIFRRMMEPADAKIAEQWLGVERGDWRRSHEEAFARGFERYLYDGKTAIPEMKGVFQKFKEWLRGIYGKLVGKDSPIQIKLPEEARQLYDRILGHGAEERIASEKEAKAQAEAAKPSIDVEKPEVRAPHTETNAVVKALRDRAEEYSRTHPGDVAYRAAYDKMADQLMNGKPVTEPMPIVPPEGTKVFWRTRGEARGAGASGILELSGKADDAGRHMTAKLISELPGAARDARFKDAFLSGEPAEISYTDWKHMTLATDAQVKEAVDRARQEAEDRAKIEADRKAAEEEVAAKRPAPKAASEEKTNGLKPPPVDLDFFDRDTAEKTASAKGSTAEKKVEEAAKESGYGSNNVLTTKDEATAARERLLARMGKKSAPDMLHQEELDPETRKDLETLGLYHFEAGARTLNALSDAVTKDIGEWAEPHMFDIFQRLKEAADKKATSRLGTLSDTDRVRAVKLSDIIGQQQELENENKQRLTPPPGTQPKSGIILTDAEPPSAAPARAPVAKRYDTTNSGKPVETPMGRARIVGTDQQGNVHVAMPDGKRAVYSPEELQEAANGKNANVEPGVSQRQRARSTNRQAGDQQRTADDEADRGANGRATGKGTQQAAGQAGAEGTGSAEAERKRGAVRGSRSGAGNSREQGDGTQPEGTEAATTAGRRVKALKEVRPIVVDAPIHAYTGEPLYDAKEWSDKLDHYLMPSNAPVPTRTISEATAKELIYPGQREVAELAISALKGPHDAFIAATSTGTGKTFTSLAVMKEMQPDYGLILTKSRNLIGPGKGSTITVASDHFDMDVTPWQAGWTEPPHKGIFVTTYAGLRDNPAIAQFKWNMVNADESGEARRWWGSEQGAKVKELGQNADKMMYISATPFHTALELGYMDKLHLWDKDGFDRWAAQLGVTKDSNGNWENAGDPRRLAKLREQLIERGQFVNQDRNMDGYFAQFGVVPLTDEHRQTMANISRAFSMAENYFKSRGQMGLMRGTRGNAVNFMKAYLERIRLPQAVELGKRLDKAGYKVAFFSETRSEVDGLYDFLQPVDQALHGAISRLLPSLPSVDGTLGKAFGDQLANFSGPHNAAREEQKNAFMRNQKKHLYATYGAGGIGVSLHDSSEGGQYPRAAVYIGMPWSGVMFDQAIGRPWRYGTNSDVRAYFLASNARPEIQLLVGKVAPRLESLRAIVSGVKEGDPLATAMRTVNGALDYEFGGKHKVGYDDFSDTVNSAAAVLHHSKLEVPPATEAMNRGMRLPEEFKAGTKSGEPLYQSGHLMPPPDDLEDAEDQYHEESGPELNQRLDHQDAAEAYGEAQNRDQEWASAELRKAAGMPPRIPGEPPSAEDVMGSSQIPPPGAAMVPEKDLAFPDWSVAAAQKGLNSSIARAASLPEVAVRGFLSRVHTAPYVLSQYESSRPLAENLTKVEMAKRREKDDTLYTIRKDILKDFTQGDGSGDRIYNALRRAQNPEQELKGKNAKVFIGMKDGEAQFDERPFTAQELRAAQRLRDEVFEPLINRARAVRPDIGYLNNYATVMRSIKDIQWAHPTLRNAQGKLAFEKGELPADLQADFSPAAREAFGLKDTSPIAKDPFSPYALKRNGTPNLDHDIFDVMDAYVPSMLKVIHDTPAIYDGIAQVTGINKKTQPMLREFAERYLRTYAGVPGEYKETYSAGYRLARLIADTNYNALLQFNPKFALLHLGKTLQDTYPTLGPKFTLAGLKSMATPEGRELLARAGVLNDLPLPKNKVARMGSQVLHSTINATEVANRGIAYLGALERAKAEGLLGDPSTVGDLSYKRLQELSAQGVDVSKALNDAYDVVSKTQFMYTPAYAQFFMKDHPIMGMFHSFTTRQSELIGNAMANYKSDPWRARRMLALLTLEAVGGVAAVAGNNTAQAALKRLWPFEFNLIPPPVLYAENTLKFVGKMLEGKASIKDFDSWMTQTGVNFVPGAGYTIREMSRKDESEADRITKEQRAREKELRERYGLASPPR